PVVSNTRNHRMDPDVPLLIPEVNAAHLDAIPVQQKNRGYDTGFIVTNPNCSTAGLVLVLKPLADAFGLEKIFVVTLQAISGAGYPGVPAMDIQANVVPFIRGEEEKMQQETQKILGEFTGEEIRPLAAKVSAHCNRVPVTDGHTVTVSVELTTKPSEQDLLACFDNFASVPQQRHLPSAPPRPIVYMPECDRPQPRRDAERERGMAVFFGRLRPCPVLDWKFVVLGHNTIRGAAGAAVRNAELMRSEGFFD